MLRDITLGQYYQADSVIHRLDPRVKLGTTSRHSTSSKTDATSFYTAIDRFFAVHNGHI